LLHVYKTKTAERFVWLVYVVNYTDSLAFINLRQINF
jgi:hypothetical protein